MQNFKVAYLIDATSRTWKRELVVNTFSEEDAYRNLYIPLASITHDDLLVC